ncbi:MAG: MFS transporter [Candidatus Hodarchaeota archaeon]
MNETTEAKVKLNYPRTFLIGFGFLTIGLTWSIYNLKVPLLLEKFFPAFDWVDFVIGIIMVLDNITAIILQPYFGALSDKTKTKFGKRMPYLMIGIPFAAISFFLVPLSPNLAILIILIMCFNLMMALYRSPVVALMPDLTPSEVRAEGNAIINLMAGFGMIAAYLIGTFLLDIDPSGFTAFSVVVLIMIACFLIVFFTINENKITNMMIEKYGPDFATDRTKLKKFRVKEKEEREGKKSFIQHFKENDTIMLFKEKEKSALFMLLTVFTIVFAYNILETFFSLFATHVLGISEGTASLLLLFLPLSFILFAIPAGKISEKHGRRKTIKVGFIIMIICFVVFVFFRQIPVIIIIFLIAGAGYSLININTITVVWQLAPEGKIGAYTGIYYLFSALAAIISPLLAGFIFSVSGFALGTMRYFMIFPMILVCLLFGFFFMTRVKRGEVILSKEEVDNLKKIYSASD